MKFNFFLNNIISYIPFQSDEIILYFIFCFLIYLSPILFTNTAYIWSLIFGLCFTATTFLTYNRLPTNIIDNDYKLLDRNINDNILFVFGTNTILFAINGYYNNSPFISLFSIIFFMCLIGFSIGYILIEYNYEFILPSITIASGIILIYGIILYICNYYCNILLEIEKLLLPGMLLIGSIVYFTSILIMSSKYYANNLGDIELYIYSNIFNIISIVLCIYIGNIFAINQLTDSYSYIIYIFLLLKIIDFFN